MLFTRNARSELLRKKSQGLVVLESMRLAWWSLCFAVYVCMSVRGRVCVLPQREPVPLAWDVGWGPP